MLSEIPEEIKNEIWAHFDEFQTIYFATAEGVKPRVRPVTLAYLDEKLWVFTGTEDEKIKQIEAIPNFEFCLELKKGEKTGYLRAAGLVKKVEDNNLKEQMAGHCHYFDQYWNAPDDPNYTLLKLDIDEIEYMRPGETSAKKYRI